MQSSSELFPVQLISAELVGTVIEDVYLLKPNNSSDHSVQIAVTRVSNKEGDHSGQPVILLHGLFSGCRHWLSADGKGVASMLVDAGYDVWLPELRGHGLSPVNKGFESNSLDAFVHHDLPAIHRFVVEQTSKSVAWIGEGAGGFLTASSLALGTIDQKTVSGFIYMEEAVALRRRVSTKVYSKKALWRFKKSGLVDGRDLTLGSESETYSVVREYLRWHRTLSYENPAGLILGSAFKSITVPSFVIGSIGHMKGRPGIRRSKMLYDQLSSKNKLFREYDYKQAQRRLVYDDGGVTLFSVNKGCWDDVHRWLSGHYDGMENLKEVDVLLVEGQ